MGKVDDSARDLSAPASSSTKAQGQSSGSLEPYLKAIEAEFHLAAGRPERVVEACARLRERIASPPSPSDLAALARLAPLLRERGSALAAPLFGLLEQTAPLCGDPWKLLEGMIAARDRDLAARAAGLTARLAESGSFPVDPSLVESLAERVEAEGSCLSEPSILGDVARIVRCLARPGREAEEPLELLYLEGTGKKRRLAARLLDLGGHPPPAGRAVRLLGPAVFTPLSSYLEYTRATHQDLLSLASSATGPPPIVAALRRAEEECGEALLRQVIAELGWPRVNLGLTVRRLIGVSLSGSLPFMVSPGEVPLLESQGGARRVSESFLFTAHGGEAEVAEREGSGDGEVARFRAYNLIHARILSEILDLSPLTGEKVQRILDSMDAIVGHFTCLFAPYTDETGVLGSVYADLRGRILAELERQTSRMRLSAELTRLVQAFEDPRNLGEVRTLHGLKRYLHQRGLHLAFRLVEAGRATNRTADILLASGRRVVRRGTEIRYVDFEPAPEAEEGRIPYPVALVAEEFGRQLLHGLESFPGVRVFCYGNEVHYFLAFANHPAFVRIDFASPLQGGMIDLEYYGVSKYDLGSHPSPDLDAICRFFRDLEFDASSEKTRIHARYDKERALDLGELCEKAEALFRLVPYLMEADWVIGSLDYGAEARDRVAAAWSRSFTRWGVLPLPALLTRDRRKILAGVEAGPAGEKDIPWSGVGEYRDRFAPVPASLLGSLQTSLKGLGLEDLPAVPEEREATIGQIDLERFLLRPLREALARGEIAADGGTLRRRGGDRFRREDPAAAFAAILGSEDGEVSAAARLARLAAPLERSLRFRTTGAVNGHEVQRSRLALRGGSVALHVLRDGEGMIRLALFSPSETLWLSREDPAAPWLPSRSTDSLRFASLLRANSYLAPGTEAPAGAAEEPPERIRDRFRRPSGSRLPPPQPGEKIVPGLRASPGRAVGRALFPGPGRRPEDFDGAVLMAPFLGPEDNTFLFHAAGVASTGGGILSHAGLIAMQFRKPSLIIAGRWRTEEDGSRTLIYRSPEYREETREMEGFSVSVRRDVREREHELREGDLVALDAGEGTLRVLGQERDTLALHEGFGLLRELGRRLERAGDAGQILALRGRLLRARYQVQKILGRLADASLARHAVQELLSGGAIPGEGGGEGRSQLLALILENRQTGGPAREHLLHLVVDLARRLRAADGIARERIPASSSLHEILAMRLDALRLRGTLAEVSSCAAACGLERPAPEESAGEGIDLPARIRLSELRDGFYWTVRVAESAPALPPGLRHALRQLRRFDRVLGNPESDLAARAERRLAREDEAALRRAGERRILGPADGGFELFPLIGWKAANLAEVERLGGTGLVPSWFVVTDRAFTEVLDSRLPARGGTADSGLPGGATLREGIDAILRRKDLDDFRKSALIRGLWEAVVLPEDLAAEILEAYARLGEESPEEPGAEEDRSSPFVAVRSSAREEDAETAARAGEFETYLFVSGGASLLDHLRRAWSGLWTERAIHNRAVLGTAASPAGGGMIVQRIAWSRVAGVLQTVNAAEGEVREMVINAGLGLGEGIVSGAVAADYVVVSKDGDLEQGPLRFRYVTGDKREKVVFNRREGLGTVRVESLYHQRLRPALEYVELLELVRAAARLEAAYGYPLDLEFGIEGSRLRILQVRPVATTLPVMGETLERYPLSAPRRGASPAPAKENGP